MSVIGLLQERVRAAIVPLDVVASAVPRGRELLEIGCGEGLFLARLATKFERLTGVDFDERKLDRARQRFVDRPEVALHVADAFAYLAQRADASVCTVALVDTLSSFEPRDQLRLLDEALRVLAPDGRLVLKVIDGAAPLKTALSTVLSTLIYRVFRLSRSARQRFTYLPADELASWLRRRVVAVELRALHRERFHPVPHVLIIARKGQGERDG
jgi:SAM-dependent methyltransferase